MIEAIVERLQSDCGSHTESAHLRKGRCPECGQVGIWTEAARPYMLFCFRLNKCGARLAVGGSLP